MLGISLFNHLNAAMAYSEKQSAISQDNLSHVEIPGHIAKSLGEGAFEQILRTQNTGNTPMGVTHAAHMALEPNSAEYNIVDAPFDHADATGNTVSETTEIVNQQKYMLSHTRHATLLKAFHGMLSTIINKVA